MNWREHIETNKLQETDRAACWHQLLNCAPLNEYETALASSAQPPVAARHNPLSLADDSAYNVRQKDAELRAEILQDVLRTFPDNAIFRDPHVEALLCQVLFAYCRSLKQPYCQGYHEVLAVIYLAIAPSTAVEEQASACFVIFSEIVPLLTPLYIKGAQNAFQGMCDHIFALLKRCDHEMHQHLERLSIEPQLYCIKWLRLMFAREFDIRAVLHLWDRIVLAKSLDFLPFFALAALISQRSIVLESNYSTALSILMRFVPNHDVFWYLKKADFLTKNIPPEREEEKPKPKPQRVAAPTRSSVFLRMEMPQIKSPLPIETSPLESPMINHKETKVKNEIEAELIEQQLPPQPIAKPVPKPLVAKVRRAADFLDLETSRPLKSSDYIIATEYAVNLLKNGENERALSFLQAVQAAFASNKSDELNALMNSFKINMKD